MAISIFRSFVPGPISTARPFPAGRRSCESFRVLQRVGSGGGLGKVRGHAVDLNAIPSGTRTAFSVDRKFAFAPPPHVGRRRRQIGVVGNQGYPTPVKRLAVEGYGAADADADLRLCPANSAGVLTRRRRRPLHNQRHRPVRQPSRSNLTVSVDRAPASRYLWRLAKKSRASSWGLPRRLQFAP